MLDFVHSESFTVKSIYLKNKTFFDNALFIVCQ